MALPRCWPACQSGQEFAITFSGLYTPDANWFVEL
jgi:hypothetical protein